MDVHSSFGPSPARKYGRHSETCLARDTPYHDRFRFRAYIARFLCVGISLHGSEIAAEASP